MGFGRTARNVFTVGSFTMLSRILGLVREMLQSRLIGAGIEQSAFTLAFAIPNMSRKLFGEGALTAAFVPVFKGEVETAGLEKAARLARSVMTMVLLLLACAVVFALAGIHGTLALSFRLALSPRAILTLELVGILLPYMLAICGAAFGMGILNSLGRFRASSFMPALLNIVWIAALGVLALVPGLSVAARIRWVAGAILLGGFAQMGYMFHRMRLAGVSPLPLFADWNSEKVRLVWRNLGIAALGAGAVQVNYMLDQVLAYLANGWAAGVIGYAERLMDLPLGVIGVAFGTVLLPTFAGLFAKGDLAGAREALASSVRTQMFVMLPAAAGLLALAPEITSVIYQGGAFDALATTRVARALAVYAVGLGFFGFQKSMVPWFQAQNDMKTPLRVSVMSVALNAVLNILAVTLLPVEWRHVGLAVSTDVCALFGCILLVAFARRRNGDLGLAATAGPLARMSAAAAAMLAALVAVRPLAANLPKIPALALLVAFGAAVYGLAALVLLRRQCLQFLRRRARVAVVGLLLASAGAASADDSWSRDAAERLLARWCDALVAHQVKGMDDPFLAGGLLCPACQFEHGRSADAVYALAYEWRRTGERKYLDCAERMLDWTERNCVGADGGNVNDVKNFWRGITVFAQISLGKTLLAFGDDLPPGLKAKWTKIFRRQTDFLVGYFSHGLGTSNINYPVAFCEAMAVAARVLGEDACLDRARAMVRLVEPYFTSDGLLQGEGHPQNRTTARGAKAVDLGYNFEESIPALWHYAELAGDAALEAKLARLTAAHLEFMLPDGGLDNSMGSRSSKWTYWGSRTSDGLLPALAHFARKGGPGAVRAIDRHLKLLERCTSDDGLLYGGLYYREAGEPACIHHTFAHVKALTDLLLLDPPKSAPSAALPRESAYGRRRFADFDTELAAVGPWRASFSANDNFSNGHGVEIGGGSMTMLWHPAFGVVCAATMADYEYVEYTNFQAQRRYPDVLSTTPRIESDGASNVRDAKVRTDASFADGVFRYSAEGHLVAADGRTGAPFSLTYALSSGGLEIRARADGKFRLLLPLVATESDRVEVDGSSASVARPGGSFVLSSSRALRLLKTTRGERAFNPIAGLMTAVFCVEGESDEILLRLNVRAHESGGRAIGVWYNVKKQIQIP